MIESRSQFKRLSVMRGDFDRLIASKGKAIRKLEAVIARLQDCQATVVFEARERAIEEAQRQIDALDEQRQKLLDKLIDLDEFSTQEDN